MRPFTFVKFYLTIRSGNPTELTKFPTQKILEDILNDS